MVAKTALTSSNLSRPLQIAAIEWCYADDDVNLLDASTLTVNTNTSRLSFTSDRGKRADFLFKAIQCLEVCTCTILLLTSQIYNDQAPTLRLALQLTEREHKQLAEIRAVYRTGRSRNMTCPDNRLQRSGIVCRFEGRAIST